MGPLNSTEDQKTSSSQSSECSASTSASNSNCCAQQPTCTQCNHLLNNVAAAQESTEDSDIVPSASRASTSAASVIKGSHASSSKIAQPKQLNNFHSKSGLRPPSFVKEPYSSKAAVVSTARRMILGSAPNPLPSNDSPAWSTAEEPTRRQQSTTNHLPEDSLQWLQALELQAVGACRSDERLRPLLRWNVSCFGSDGRLLAHLGQHFKARELASLTRYLYIPVVSLRVGKVSRHGRYLYPTSARGYLNLMLLPCSEMRLSFADDIGTVERVAFTLPGVESGGILIEELDQDTSRRTFVLKDQGGNITNYFWQSEKLKNTGDELISKIRNMLKRRPTLAHLTGIDEGRLDSCAEYLRIAICCKASTSLSQKATSPTQVVPPVECHEESSNSNPLSKSATSLPFRRPLLKFSTLLTLSTPSHSQNHIIPSPITHSPRMGGPSLTSQQPFETSMEKQSLCMQEFDTSVCSDDPLQSIVSSLPGTAKLIESLKRLRNCLHSLSDRRSSKARILDPTPGLRASSSHAGPPLDDTDSSIPHSEREVHLRNHINKPLIRSVLSASPFPKDTTYHPKAICSSPDVLPGPSPVTTLPIDECLVGRFPAHLTGPILRNVDAQQAVAFTTVVYRDLGPTLDPAGSLQAHPVQYCPSVTKVFDFRRPVVRQSNPSILSDLFTELVAQLPLMISHTANETLSTHNLYIFPFVLEHGGARSLPHLSVLPHVLDHLRRANLLHLPASSGHGVPFLRESLPMPSAPDESCVSRQRGRRPDFVEHGLGIPSTAGLRVSEGLASRELDTGISGMELFCQPGRETRRRSNAQCSACHRCAAGTGLGNLVLVNFYAQQTGPSLIEVTAEITSGNTSYIVRFFAEILA